MKILYGTNTVDYQFLTLDGTYKTVHMILSSFSIKTNFACSGIVEYTGTASLPTEIDLPNGKSYFFTYEPTPSFSGYYTGRVQRVTLPTGGYYEYDYPTTGSDGINCADGTGTNLTRKISDGATTATWSFTRVPTTGSGGTTTVTAPALPYDTVGNDAVYAFDTNGHETSRKFYQGAAGGTLLRTINTTWAANGSPATQVTILEDNSTSEVDTSFDSNGNLLTLSEYDWGSGTRGGLLRTTTLTYLSSSAYTSRNILNRVATKTVADVNGTTKFRQDIAYDGTSSFTVANCITGAIQHDDTNYGCSFLTRGNPISVTTYKDPVTPANGVVKNFTYDSLGNLRQAAVNCCQQKQWNYSATTQYAFPDSVVSGPSGGTQLTTSSSYNSYTGLVTLSTDENGKQTTLTYDLTTLRLTDIQRPDNAHITYGYDDTARTVTVTSPIQGASTLRQITAYDGLGRPVTTTVQDTSQATYSIVQTQYDPLSRGYRASNPYTGSPCAQCWTETRFDGLGRPTKTILQDNGQTTYAYAGTSVTITDPTGKQRKSVLDAAGRLTKVTEPNTSGVLNVDTTYAYTVLDAPTTTNQGVQTRTYSYDALGRLTSAATPEAGTVSYQYNDFDLVTQRTDARNVISTYGYDTLNRLTSMSYNVGSTGVPATPTVTFGYDAGGAAANALGRLTSMTDGVGSETYSYDPNLPRLTQVQKVISGTTYTTGYGYNLAGELTSITYPSGRVVQPSYDGIGRLTTIASGGTNYASGYAYNPAFQVTGMNYGNGVTASFGYSADRMQLTSLAYTKSTTTLFSLSYGYTQNGGNNGQITSITDSVDNGRSVTYTYDPLARVSTAVTTGSTNYPQWGLSWTYDQYGNRTAQSIAAGCVAPQTCPTNAVTIDATTNRITGTPYSYDANGNMTNDGLNTLAYDAENRLVTSSGSTYSYDGNNLRVKKVSGSTTTVYLFSGSKVVAEYVNGAAPGSPTKEYIYSGSALVATLAGSSTTYHHADHLSVRVTTDTSGNVLAQQAHYPYGEAWYQGSSGTKWQFTSYERDGESGNDYAMARYHVNRLGRFSSPDPIAGSAANPQSLNRYAYVRGDPGNLVDPLGLRCEIVPINGDPTEVCRDDRPVGDDRFFNEFLLCAFAGICRDRGGDGGTRGDPGRDRGERGGLPGGGVDFTKLGSKLAEPPACPVNAQSLDAYLKDSPLAGQGDALLNAGRAYNVDPRFVIALAGAETSFGRNITWGQYNAWNWGWNTRDPRNSPFSSWGAGINAVSRGIGGPSYLRDPQGRYNTTSAIYQKYCQGPDCVNGLRNLSTSLAQQGGDPNSLHFPCK